MSIAGRQAWNSPRNGAGMRSFRRYLATGHMPIVQSIGNDRLKPRSDSVSVERISCITDDNHLEYFT